MGWEPLWSSPPLQSNSGTGPRDWAPIMGMGSKPLPKLINQCSLLIDPNTDSPPSKHPPAPSRSPSIKPGPHSPLGPGPWLARPRPGSQTWAIDHASGPWTQARRAGPRANKLAPCAGTRASGPSARPKINEPRTLRPGPWVPVQGAPSSVIDSRFCRLQFNSHSHRKRALSRMPHLFSSWNLGCVCNERCNGVRVLAASRCCTCHDLIVRNIYTKY